MEIEQIVIVINTTKMVDGKFYVIYILPQFKKSIIVIYQKPLHYTL